MRSCVLSLIAVIALSVLVACSSGGSNRGASPSASAKRSPVTPTVTSSATIKVEQQDFNFSPNQFTGTAGRTLSIDLKNTGKSTHSFTIDSLHVDKTLKPGEETTFTLTPDQAGQVQFYCRFHKSAGMTGTFDVGVAPGAPSR